MFGLYQDDADPFALRPGTFHFLLTMVDGENAEDVSKRIGRVATVAFEHNAIVDGIISNLVVVTSGTFPQWKVQPQVSSFAVVSSALSREMGTNIRAVYGTSSGHFGNVGNDHRMTYTFVSPVFHGALACLCGLRPGEVSHYPQDA